jgi:predicted aldo/keto reductase-like oxidoreductase
MKKNDKIDKAVGVVGENRDESGPAGASAVTRRQFIGIAAATLISVHLHPGYAETAREVPYRKLGSTGEKVSTVGIGGFHLGKPEVTEAESIRIVRTAIDNGINFMDNSWDYNGGESEIRMGKALRDGYRQRVFLMTKIDGRNKKTAAQQIEDSLRRLQTDHLDLLQFHEVIRMEDPERIFAAGGALEAALEAKKAGKIRYIGFTGHKNPDIHLKMLDTAASHQFRFDTVQMPLNLMDAHFESFEKKVLPVLVKADIGVLGMKSMGDRIILESKVVTPVECLLYAMNLPTSVVITGCDSMRILDQALNVARNFQPMTPKETEALLAKTARAAQAGKFELYKTSHQFDSTYQNPQWLG